MLNNPISVERVIGGRTLTIETNKIAKQATGAVTVRYGDTIVLAAATFGPEIKNDFFPLSCDYREKTYAAGRFPGGFFKREGRPTDKETLTSRLCDRPHRPLFPKGYRNEVSIMMTVISADAENEPDTLAMVGASAALSLCEGYPFMGPTGSVRVGRIGGELVINPTHEEILASDLDIVVSGIEGAIIMVEGSAKELPEDVLLGALDFASEAIGELIAMQKELVEKAGKKLYEAPAEGGEGADAAFLGEVEQRYYQAICEANQRGTESKFARKDALKAVKKQVLADHAEQIAADADLEKRLKSAISTLERKAVREQILSDRKRADGRDLDGIRPIEIEIGYLPRAHGSALFTRGETQALVVATLGTWRDTQRIDGLLPEKIEKEFYLQYNFPPYCVGETWPYRGPRRREIGHGDLAERSVRPVVPETERFPYTLRVVSEVTESNGSSSMASVCGATLSLMDAGVPIKRPVAGIAMGLVKEGDRYGVLSDITGHEDAEGDMDFKVSGSQSGITGFQMDIKVKGISREIMAEALEQARKGRLEILRRMVRAIDRPRDRISKYAPRLIQVRISSDKVGALIGPGGKNIRKIQEDTRCQIDIDDQAGVATISGGPGADVDECVRLVKACTEEVEVGKIYKGKVVSVREFGVFVEILPGTEGMCHVSELSESFVKNVADVAKVGDEVEVKVVSIDSQNRVRLSKKAADEERRKERGEEAPGDRGGDRGESGGGSGGDDDGGSDDDGGDRRGGRPPRRKAGGKPSHEPEEGARS